MSNYRLNIQPLRIPFRHAFRHASATRAETCAVLVQADNGQGISGYGEGCPRAYVTGESIDGSLAFFHQVAARVCREINGPDDLKTWVRSHADLIDRNPAAWCAIETALLDLFARERHISLEQVLGLPALGGEHQYTAVLGDMSIPAYEAMLQRYRAYGFHDYKIKLSGDLERDREKLARMISGERLRADANNLWKEPRQATQYLRALDSELFAVEEPLDAGDYAGLSQLAADTGMRIILDESFTRLAQLEELKEHSAHWLLNLRVSKIGGLMRSLDILRAVKTQGIPIIVGAQVGETSILTRCGLTLAHAAGDSVIAREGAFGTLLLEHDICGTPLMFSHGGRLPSTAIQGAGLGLRVSEDLLNTCAKSVTTSFPEAG